MTRPSPLSSEGRFERLVRVVLYSALPITTAISVVGRAFSFSAFFFGGLLFLGSLGVLAIRAILKRDRWALCRLLLMAVLCCTVYLVAVPFVFGWQTELEMRQALRELPAALEFAASNCTPRDVVGIPGDRLILVDCGPPVRLVFQFGLGFLDNWGGIVHDPSGGVREIPDAHHTVIEALPHPLRELFGGMIVSCEDLGKDMYDCWFT